MAQFEKAKVFMSGRSQAVRIPAKFRFAPNEVYIRSDRKNGDVILSQAPNGLQEMQEIFDAFDRSGLPISLLRIAISSRPRIAERTSCDLKRPKAEC